MASKKNGFITEMDNNQRPNADGHPDRQISWTNLVALASDEHISFAKYLKPYHFPVQNRII